MMERRNSMAPTDDELLRLALDEEPLPHAMKEYLEQCATSRQQFALYKRTHSYLLSKLYRHQCPTATRLNLYCAGRLSGDEEKCITHHMAACPLCTDEAVMICRVLADFEPFPDMHSR